MSYNNKDDPSSSSSLNGIENVSIALKFKKRLAVIYIRNERGEKAVSKNVQESSLSKSGILDFALWLMIHHGKVVTNRFFGKSLDRKDNMVSPKIAKQDDNSLTSLNRGDSRLSIAIIRLNIK